MIVIPSPLVPCLRLQRALLDGEVSEALQRLTATRVSRSHGKDERDGMTIMASA